MTNENTETTTTPPVTLRGLADKMQQSALHYSQARKALIDDRDALIAALPQPARPYPGGTHFDIEHIRLAAEKGTLAAEIMPRVEKGEAVLSAIAKLSPREAALLELTPAIETT